MKRVSKQRSGALPCSCRGTLREVLVRRYDATEELGIPAILTGRLRAYRCDACQSVVATGAVLEAAARKAILSLLREDRVASGAEARFLRKAALAVGQVEVADLLGVSRPTVARWEAESALSPEHDFELKGLVIGALLRSSGARHNPWRPDRNDILRLAAEVMRRARQRRPRGSKARLYLAA
jgi:DNA-binding transcriptional regulator YiaG